MECNKDEAIRAKNIAEQKFAMQDFVGAKKFIVKAQQLYSPLEGAFQMLAVLDVHIAAQVKLGINETDWYGILQVEPLSDDNTIKKQYRKLALLLHPDKNKSGGAEAAFKLIGEAFGVLSDKAKRYLHDSKRGGESKVSQVASHASEPLKPTHYAYQAQHSAAAHTTSATGAQAPHSPSTFWTACPLCRMQYQYLRTYLGYQLLCQKCHKPFLASDINVHSANASAFSWPRGPFENGSCPTGTVSQKAGSHFQSWARNGGVAPRNVAGNGYTHSPGGPHAIGNRNNSPGGTACAGASGAAAASLVHEAYRKAQRDRVDAGKELKRKDRENEREKEKILRHQEREAMKKARENVKTHEAMERLMKKREEAIRKAAMKVGMKKRQKKRKRNEDEDEDEDEGEGEGEDEDDEDEDEDEDADADADDLQRYNSACRSRPIFGKTLLRQRSSWALGPDESDTDFEACRGAKLRSGRIEKVKSSCDGGGGGAGAGGVGLRAAGAVDGDGDGGWVGVGDGNWGSDGEGEGDGDGDGEWEWAGAGDGDGAGAGAGDGDELWVGGSGIRSKPEFCGIRLKDPLQDQLAERFRRELAAKLGIPTRDLTEGAEQMDKEQRLNTVIGSGGAMSVQQSGSSTDDNEKLNAVGGTDKEAPTVSTEEAIVVPDPDFHDFDVDRTELHVRKNQVWAVFDETDGMPRFYCQINKVRRDPFMVEAMWLEPIHPFKDTLFWLKKRDLSISCGEFKLGDEVDFDSINMFSHLMSIRRWKNGYEVYPKRPEVWAIYRDYDIELPSSQVDGRVQFRYDFVLIRSDFSAITGGGRVVRLEKLAGFRSLWAPTGDAFPLTVKYDLHKFSHRVPASLVTEENIGVPAECLELDPASTPSDSIGP